MATRSRTIKDTPKRGKLTKSEVRKAVEKVVYGQARTHEMTFKIGRDVQTGQFIPVKEAQRRKKTAKVETIKRPAKVTIQVGIAPVESSG